MKASSIKHIYTKTIEGYTSKIRFYKLSLSHLFPPCILERGDGVHEEYIQEYHWKDYQNDKTE